MLMPQRPAIPKAIKRAVRQKCGFGCIICGMPFFHYDHVVSYSQVQEHSEDNLILLCPNHHQAKNSGLLPISKIAKAVANPHNKSRSHSAAHTLLTAGSKGQIILGSVEFTFDFERYPSPEGFAAFVVNGTALIGMTHEDGNFLLYFYGADEDGMDSLIIERGELVVRTDLWDYELKGHRFIVRRRPSPKVSGKIVLDLLKLDRGFKVTSGLVLHQGYELRIKDDEITVLPQRVTIRDMGFKDCYAGISVGNPKVGFICLN